MKATITNISKRIVIRKNRVDHILSYDIDNMYAQRMVDIVNASGTASACVKKYVKFMLGGGFEDKIFYKSKINRLGLTIDKLARKTCHSISMHNGVAYQVNYNALYEISEVNFIPFSYCRLTMSDDEKYANKCAVYDNWDRIKKNRIEFKNIQFLNFFNPDPKIIQAQVDAAGGWHKYTGQIFYWTENGIEYPLSIFDSIIEDIQTDAEVKLFKFRNISTNFMASHILFSPEIEQKEDNQEQDDWDLTLGQFQGADNASKILNIQTNNKDAFDIKKLDIQAIDSIFSYTEKSVKENIITSFEIPKVLLNITEGGKLGTSKEIQDATEYLNNNMEYYRIIIEEIFTELFSKFAEPINPSGNYVLLPYKNNVASTLIDELGAPGAKALADILALPVAAEQKSMIMQIILGIDPEDADAMSGVGLPPLPPPGPPMP